MQVAENGPRHGGGCSHCKFHPVQRSEPSSAWQTSQRQQHYPQTAIPHWSEMVKPRRCAEHFFDLQEEIGQYMEKKGKPVLELQPQEWLQDLAFLVDITEHTTIRTKCCKAAKKFSDNIHASNLKLTLWETQLANGNPAHFPCLRVVCVWPDLMRTWNGTKTRLQDYCGSLRNVFRYLVNLRQNLQFFAHLSQVKLLICYLKFSWKKLICSVMQIWRANLPP